MLFQIDDRRQLLLSVIDLKTKVGTAARSRGLHAALIRLRLHPMNLSRPDYSTSTDLTGREPRLAHKKGHYRLSLRGLGTMLNMLPPEAISLDAAAAALRNKDFYVRYNAARLLRRRGDRDARQIMEDALISGDVPTRASVARELYGFSWYSAEPLLRRALNDEDVRVHECAVYALCDLRELHGYQLMVGSAAPRTR